MNEYFWIPHIHSEMIVTKSILKQSRSLQETLFERIDDVEDVDITSINHSEKATTITINIGKHNDQQRMNMTIHDSGFCRIEPLDGGKNIRPSAHGTMAMVIFAIIRCLGSRTYIDDDNTGGENNLLNNFGLVSAENDHDAIIELFDNMITSCEVEMDFIMNSTYDPLSSFGHLNRVIEHLTFAESFVESVKDQVPEEYDGMMSTLRRYRQHIDNRNNMIRTDRDIRRERGEQELNAHALSISRSVYYLSVLGIGVSMFGASIVADSLISISPLVKACMISVASVSVLTACWWISKSMMGKKHHKETRGPGCYTDRTVTP